MITVADIDRVIAERGLWYCSVPDAELRRRIDSNQAAVERYKHGDAKAVHAIVGQVMKQYRGADASEVSARLVELIEGA